jgi:hypothetical protein
MNFEKVDNYFPGLFAGSYTFPSYAAYLSQTPSGYQQAFSAAGTQPPASHPNINEYAFFVQDGWRVNNRLTLNLGVRYDYFSYNQPATLNQNPQLLSSNLRTNRIATDPTNVGPRFGFAFKPFDNERTVIRGGYGIFYARTAGLLLSTAILQNGIDVLTFAFTPGTPVFPTYPNIVTSRPTTTLTPDIYVTDANFKTAQTQQYSFQIEHQIGRDYSVQIGYLGVHGTHLTRTRDINLYPSSLDYGNDCRRWLGAVLAASWYSSRPNSSQCVVRAHQPVR